MIEKALFGAGCFWGVEETFRKLKGVKSTAVGYSGGNTNDPTYETVCQGNTNHAEVVLIDFDNQIISFQNLLDHFWECHDPTTLNRQGPDIGTQYKSVIFFYDNNQKKISLESKKIYSENNNLNIVTEILKAQDFYKAEEYHQKYIQKTGLHCAI